MQNNVHAALSLVLFTTVGACAGHRPTPHLPLQDAPAATESLIVTSEAFGDRESIPEIHSFDGFGCVGQNTAPTIRWRGAPPETRSFAVVMHDPDAPTGVGFFHWVVSNIPASTNAIGGSAGLPSAAQEHHNDYGAESYGGPCPPEGHGPHRYVFSVYALDTESLGLSASATGALLRFAIADHILAYGRLVGTFER